MTISSRTTFEVWQYLIYDEALSRAVFDGSWPALAAKRAYTPEEIEVLAWFAAQPGMRWNVENLRFRTALETGAALCIHMPRTTFLLTQGNDDWLQDTCYEYLAHHSWDALGHRRLTECERFGAYTRNRIMRRRSVPAHFEQVMELELAIIEVHRKTAAIARDAWPAPPVLTDAELAAVRPRRSIAQRVLEQPVDLRPFMAADKALTVEVRPQPVTWLIYIPSITENHHLKVISEGPRVLLERCTGERTTAEIAASMEQDFELPADQVSRLVRTWLTEGVLVAPAIEA